MDENRVRRCSRNPQPARFVAARKKSATQVRALSSTWPVTETNYVAQSSVTLPRRLWELVFRFLLPCDLLVTAQVSRLWREIADSDVVWRTYQVGSFTPSCIRDDTTAKLVINACCEYAPNVTIYADIDISHRTPRSISSAKGFVLAFCWHVGPHARTASSAKLRMHVRAVHFKTCVCARVCAQAFVFWRAFVVVCMGAPACVCEAHAFWGVVSP
jgi:hypothetical protein